MSVRGEETMLLVQSEPPPSWTGKRIGTRVSGYKLERLIGTGGTGEVYQASDDAGDGRRVAIKILNAELAGLPEVRRRFYSELNITLRIQHPARVRIFDCATTDDGAPALVMELLQGESLHARLRREGQFRVVDALTVIERLLDFLKVCHHARVVHRDLKPANIFICEDSSLRVLDFGIARDGTRNRTSRRFAVGTPSFMSPEQAMGFSEAQDERCDIFATGAILFALLSGSTLRTAKPGERSSPRDALDEPASIRSAVSDLPADLAALVDRATAWHRDARWSTAVAMQSEVQELLAKYGHLTGWRASRVSR